MVCINWMDLILTLNHRRHLLLPPTPHRFGSQFLFVKACGAFAKVCIYLMEHAAEFITNHSTSGPAPAPLRSIQQRTTCCARYPKPCGANTKTGEAALNSVGREIWIAPFRERPTNLQWTISEELFRPHSTLWTVAEVLIRKLNFSNGWRERELVPGLTWREMGEVEVGEVPRGAANLFGGSLKMKPLSGKLIVLLEVQMRLGRRWCSTCGWN